MIKLPVSDGKVSDLVRRMEALSLREEDIEESYYRPSGKGSKNSLTGVMLLHKATGIRIRCNRESSQGINRFVARRSLVEELEARLQNKTRHEVKAEQIRQDKLHKLRRKGSRKRTQALPNPFGMSTGELAFIRKEQEAEKCQAASPPPPQAAPRSLGGGGGSGGSSLRGGFDLARAERAFILRMPANGLPTMF